MAARSPSPTPRPDAIEAPGAPVQNRFRRVASQNKLQPKALFPEGITTKEETRGEAIAALNSVEDAMRTMCNLCDDATLFDTAWSKEFNTIRAYLN